MSIEGFLAAIGGPTAIPHQPEGGSEATALNPLGLDRTGAEPAPENVTAQQGAGGGYLYPGAQGLASDGHVLVGGNRPDSSTGPEQRPVLPGTVARLTAGQVNRPEGGPAPAASPVGRPDTALGRDQSLGQGLNPMLKPANAPRQDGPFGKPS